MAATIMVRTRDLIWLVDRDDLRVSYARKRRTVRDMGWATESEDAGPDKSRFELQARDGKWRTPAGPIRVLGGTPVERTNLKRQVRQLPTQTELDVLTIDREILELQVQIRDLRVRRADKIKRAWRHGRELNGLDLQDMADDELAAREQREVG